MSARAHGGIGGVGPRGGCRGGSGGGGNSEAAARRRARRKTNPLSLQVFIDLPPNLRSAVVGRGGETVKHIQETSGAKVKVPAAGRNGRVKVIGDEVPLLAACRAIAQVALTSSSEAADGLDVLDIAVDAGPQLGRLNGSMHVNRAGDAAGAGAGAGDDGSEAPTLLCRASATAPNGVEFAYIAHAVHVPANAPSPSDAEGTSGDDDAKPQNLITQEDVEVTLDNYAFAQGGGSSGDNGPGDLPISICCVKDDHIFVSGIEIVGASTSGGGIDAVVAEMKKLVRL
mmetsp:Transcript_11576/g.32862  ORF Transcript_11576/g.32862 Transcript_11576/m.32862 type:complete len:285 (-) Transcript_11576:1465-2319(-)